jgi:excisionase family DNA binding protein
MKGPTGMPSAGTTDHLREHRQPKTIEPIALRVPEACRYLGIGRSTLYVLINEGEIEFIKLGSSTLVLTASLRSLVERRRKPADDQAGRMEK